MSADNTIAIVKFDDGYRVSHIQNMENIPERDWDEWEDWINYCFGSEKIMTKEEARQHAVQEYEKEWYIEYGITEHEVVWYIPQPVDLE